MKKSPNLLLRMLLGVATASCAFTSTAQPPAAFEAVSIHRNVTGSTSSHTNISGDRLTMTNASLRGLIRSAYDIQSFQLEGGPSWLDSDAYDIAATTGDGADISHDQYRALLKTMLLDRFHLKAHWETREGTIYALVIAKKGNKLTESPDPAKQPGLNTNRQHHQGRMVANNAPVSYLSSSLGNLLGRTVVERTGLTGKYDWMLEWDPDPSEDSTTPSLFTAVEEQLGLKLVPQKGPVQTLVIDSVERPSEN